MQSKYQTNKLTSRHITTITVCGEVIITILFIQASESEWLEISEEEDDDDDDEADDDENEEGDASQTDEDEEEVCTSTLEFSYPASVDPNSILD